MSRAAIALVVLLAGACQGLPAADPCGEIPEGACPVGRGGTCDDVSCNALYTCENGTWVHVETCPARDAGGEEGGAAPDAGQCTPVSIDTSSSTTGCTPDLENPDCPVQAALGCVETACTTGCLDFFLCTESGWNDVAYCTDDGELVVTQ